MTDFLHAFSALTIMEQEKILERLEKKVEKITHQIYGEASPDYLVSPTALANMLRYVKILFFFLLKRIKALPTSP